MSEPRFFIDHGVIHDRITGRHMHGDRDLEPGVADEAILMLNDLHLSALREIKSFGRIAELEAALATARRDALEEAAKVCEQRAIAAERNANILGGHVADHRADALYHAVDAIRALQAEPTQREG